EELTLHIKGFQDQPTVIQAKNMLIDDSGLSGEAKASSVFSMEEGSADGWAMSINELSLRFAQNKLTAGTFTGEIQVPLLGDEPFGYAGEIEQADGELNYKFHVNTAADK